MVCRPHYQNSYCTHSDSQLIKKLLLGWRASCYIASTYIVTAVIHLLFESLECLLEHFLHLRFINIYFNFIFHNFSCRLGINGLCPTGHRPNRGRFVHHPSL